MPLDRAYIELYSEHMTFVLQLIAHSHTGSPWVCFYFCKRVRLSYVLNSDLIWFDFYLPTGNLPMGVQNKPGLEKNASI